MDLCDRDGVYMMVMFFSDQLVVLFVHCGESNCNVIVMIRRYSVVVFATYKIIESDTIVSSCTRIPGFSGLNVNLSIASTFGI